MAPAALWLPLCMQIEALWGAPDYGAGRASMHFLVGRWRGVTDQGAVRGGGRRRGRRGMAPYSPLGSFCVSRLGSGG